MQVIQLISVWNYCKIFSDKIKEFEYCNIPYDFLEVKFKKKLNLRRQNLLTKKNFPFPQNDEISKKRETFSWKMPYQNLTCHYNLMDSGVE